WHHAASCLLFTWRMIVTATTAMVVQTMRAASINFFISLGPFRACSVNVTCLQYRQNVAPLPIWYRLYRANLSMLSYPVARAARAVKAVIVYLYYFILSRAYAVRDCGKVGVSCP